MSNYIAYLNLCRCNSEVKAISFFKKYIANKKYNKSIYAGLMLYKDDPNMFYEMDTVKFLSLINKDKEDYDYFDFCIGFLNYFRRKNILIDLDELLRYIVPALAGLKMDIGCNAVNIKRVLINLAEVTTVDGKSMLVSVDSIIKAEFRMSTESYINIEASELLVNTLESYVRRYGDDYSKKIKLVTIAVNKYRGTLDVESYKIAIKYLKHCLENSISTKSPRELKLYNTYEDITDSIQNLSSWINYNKIDIRKLKQFSLI